ncbi:hypothetical protein V5O48_018438 [Marasmius crinis-equi]|uniref:Uncharacterized protein n=1 Tax=Marasmius crinis-equi TaxID=585013 RepID=A0ABR3EL72_9AGAR
MAGGSGYSAIRALQSTCRDNRKMYMLGLFSVQRSGHRTKTVSPHSSFQEHPNAPVRTVLIPNNARATRIASIVQMLVQWLRLQAVQVPSDVEALLNMPADMSSERGRRLAAAVSRMNMLLEQRRRMRRVLYDMLGPYFTRDERGRRDVPSIFISPDAIVFV